MSTVTPTARPRLARHVRQQWDPVRERQVLLAPESVLMLNETAIAILALCDGERSVSAIAAELSAQYNRPVDQDVLMFLQRLADKQMIELSDE
jgi:pyrroloquinoline quinone biosynthesis protein D